MGVMRSGEELDLISPTLPAVRHHWYEQVELQGRSLGQELLQNSKYRDITFIWPQTSLEWAIGARERSISATSMAQRKPRQLPSMEYFDNQDAGMNNAGGGGIRYWQALISMQIQQLSIDPINEQKHIPITDQKPQTIQISYYDTSLIEI